MHACGARNIHVQYECVLNRLYGRYTDDKHDASWENLTRYNAISIILLLFLFRVGVGGTVESNIMNKHMHFADCGAKFTHASFGILNYCP